MREYEREADDLLWRWRLSRRMLKLPCPGDRSKVDFSVNRQCHAHLLVPMTRTKEEREQIVFPAANVSSGGNGERSRRLVFRRRAMSAPLLDRSFRAARYGRVKVRSWPGAAPQPASSSDRYQCEPVSTHQRGYGRLHWSTAADQLFQHPVVTCARTIAT